MSPLLAGLLFLILLWLIASHSRAGCMAIVALFATVVATLVFFSPA